MKKILTAIVALAIAMTAMIIPSVSASAASVERTNIAQGATATFRNFDNNADVTLDPDPYPASNAVDGDESTYAQVNNGGVWSLVVDLGAVHYIDEAEILYGARGSRYEVLFSKAGSGDWYYAVEKSSQATSSGDVTLDIELFPREARYIMIRGTSGVNYSVKEVRVYETENITENASISFTNKKDDSALNYDGTLLKDGSFGTYVGPGLGDSYGYAWHTTIELDKEYIIDEVAVAIRTFKIAKTFTVETSTDGVTYARRGSFTTVYTDLDDRTTGRGGQGIYTAKFDVPVSAKYVRILDQGGHTGIGLVVAEVAVIKSADQRVNIATKADGIYITDRNGNTATTNNAGTSGLNDEDLSTICGIAGTSVSGNPYSWDITMEWEDAHIIGEVDVVFATANVAGGVYDIETSLDGSTYKKRGSFTTPGNQPNNGTNYIYTAQMEPSAAKYVRIKDASEAHPNTGYVVREVLVYETGASQALYTDDISYSKNGAEIDALETGTITASVNMYAPEAQDAVLITGLFDGSNNRLIRCNTSEYKNISGFVPASVTLNVSEGIPERVNLVTTGCSAYLRNHDNTEDQNANGSTEVDGVSTGGHMASYICDGDEETYAMGSGTYDGAMILEFEKAEEIGQIDVLFERVTPDYDILVSADGEEYTLVKNVTGDSGNGLRSFTLPAQQVQYIMVRNNSTTKTQGIYEIYAYDAASLYQIRTFIWRSLDDLTPLSDVYVLSN